MSPAAAQLVGRTPLIRGIINLGHSQTGCYTVCVCVEPTSRVITLAKTELRRLSANTWTHSPLNITAVWDMMLRSPVHVCTCFSKKLLLPSSGWGSKSNVEESGIDAGRQAAGVGVLREPTGERWKSLRFLKGSLCQGRETGEITALSNWSDKEMSGDSIRNSHFLLLVPNKTN
jgi:hypothetical protein